ncbi:MAG: hypothetical protein AB7T59_07590 [Hyphomonadaceae bacterium]
MIPPPDPFAQEFDAIDVDPARAPAREAIESAMAHLAPQNPLLAAGAAAPALPQPGFFLLDDADGRFVVDRDMGVVTITDETLLLRERNTIHAVKLRVVEPSGASYDLEMQLRISGRVPQMVGAEEFAAIAGLTDETVLTALRVPSLVIAAETVPAIEPASPTVEPEPIAWTRFAVAQGHAARTPRLQPRRSFIAVELPETDLPVRLSFDGLPAPFSSHLPWSL